MVLEIGVAEVVPERAAVLAALGVPTEREDRPHLRALVDAALSSFSECAVPVAVLADVAAEDFARVLGAAEGNAPASVVGDVSRRARSLSLFVVTLGPAVSEAVARAFEERDFALGTALDAVASEAADRAAERVERRVEARLREEGVLARDGSALRYSPGYCGWHVSGQAALFRRLAPERVGVRLTDAGFMQPEKSVSGVVLAGPRSIHRISPTYPFCAQCTTRSCVDRMRTLFGRRAAAAEEAAG